MTEDKSTERKRPTVSTFQVFSEAMRDILPYTHLPYQLVSSILVMFGIGYGIDALTESSPLYTVIGSVAGVAIGLYLFIKTALQLSDKKKSKPRTPNDIEEPFEKRT